MRRPRQLDAASHRSGGGAQDGYARRVEPLREGVGGVPRELEHHAALTSTTGTVAVGDVTAAGVVAGGDGGAEWVTSLEAARVARDAIRPSVTPPIERTTAALPMATTSALRPQRRRASRGCRAPPRTASSARSGDACSSDSGSM